MRCLAVITTITFHWERRGTDKHPHLLTSFTDADFTGDSNDRQSMSGWVFRFNNSPVSWASKKQGLVTRSLMELELVAGSFASVEGVWLIHLGRDFRHDFIPIPCSLTINPSSYTLRTTSATLIQSTKIHTTTTHMIRSQVGISSYIISPYTRTLLTFSLSLYHCTNMYNSSKLLELHMFEGVCCDKINMITFFLPIIT